MGVDGTRAQHQPLGDLAVGQAGGHQSQHFGFAVGEPGRPDLELTSQVDQQLLGDLVRPIGIEPATALVRLGPVGIAQPRPALIRQTEPGNGGKPGHLVVIAMPASCGAVELRGHRPAALFDAQSCDDLNQVGPGGHQPMGSLEVECPQTRVDGLDPFPTQLMG